MGKMSVSIITHNEAEAMSCGALLLNEDNRSLRKLFRIEKDLDIYPEDNLAVLVEKIKFYLSNEFLREKIARSGQEKVLSEHTYTLKVRKILGTLKNSEHSTFSETRIFLANSLVYYDEQFRMYKLAKDYFFKAVHKDWKIVIKNLVKYFLYNRIEKIRKLFKIWSY